MLRLRLRLRTVGVEDGAYICRLVGFLVVVVRMSYIDQRMFIAKTRRSYLRVLSVLSSLEQEVQGLRAAELVDPPLQVAKRYQRTERRLVVKQRQQS